MIPICQTYWSTCCLSVYVFVLVCLPVYLCCHLSGSWCWPAHRGHFPPWGQEGCWDLHLHSTAPLLPGRTEETGPGQSAVVFLSFRVCVCVCVCFTRSFPLAIARERGECPLQRRSVLALWESRRATTLLAFCKTNKHTILLWWENFVFYGRFFDESFAMFSFHCIFLLSSKDINISGNWIRIYSDFKLIIERIN